MVDHGSLGELKEERVRSDYSWQCLICGTSNSAASDGCARCGFSVRATGREIAQAKAEYGASANRLPLGAIKPEGKRESFFDMIAPLSAWRQALAITGALLALAGGATLKIVLSFAALGWGALALVGGLMIAGLAVAGYRPPHGTASGSD